MATPTAAKRILVVDDQRSVCASVEKILVRRGHAVEQALSVAAAVEYLARGPVVDLILADLMMPQQSGLDLVRIVRDRWPSTPVVIMTGYASIASAIEATRTGAVGYLPKPFTPDELDAALAHATSTLQPPMAKAAVAVPAEQQRVPDSGDDVLDDEMPFDAAAVTARFVKPLTHSGMPVVSFCPLGQRTCRHYAKEGVCQEPTCPLTAAGQRKQIPATARAEVHGPNNTDLPIGLADAAEMTSGRYTGVRGGAGVPAADPSDDTSAADYRVLVVDDEPVVANSIRRTLIRRGFQVEEAFTGREALTRIRDGTYDLVLLDMRMPDAHGLDLLPLIHKRRPRLPVVVVTGYASIDTAVEAIRRGASDYLAKPFTPDELCTTARRAIRRA